MTPADRPDLPAPRRILLGPGPSDVPARVLRAMATPIVSHLDPEMLVLLDRIAAQLREVFRTTNRLTLLMPGTGMSAMEGAIVNLVEPGDTVLVGTCGVFGRRMADIARRAGAEVVEVEAPWGRIVDPDAMRRAIAEHRPRVVAIVHGETSTGIEQPVAEIAAAARDHGALTVVDTVASLGGVPFDVDASGADVVYSGSQKCLSCPPGLAPITLGPRAEERLRARTRPVQSFYLDLTLLDRYWNEPHVYHHTAATSLYYAMYEGLRVVLEEGLERRIARHAACHRALLAGLEALGIGLASDPEHRLPVLNPVEVPDGVDAHRVRRRLLAEHGIEVGAGLGELADRVWRVGLMGESARPNNVLLLLAALERILREEGARCGTGAVEAAASVFGSAAD
ncbi:MAG: alanine--glyoxylate aminotransferase family protein [Acidobacteria bacterium]|nr:MAG: alanine--glyoxylate aminotransferase family protein [Acidobacteriota bacterium]